MVDLVAEALRERGMEWLDHTPGGDEYKEEAASTHEPIQRLLLFPSRRRAWAYGIETAARDVLKRAARVAGLSSARLRGLQERAVRAARSPVSTGRVAARSLRSWTWSSTAMITYRLTRQAWEAGNLPR